MLFDDGMATHTNDNDTWQPIGLAARRLLVNLSKKKNEQEGEEPGPETSDEQKRADEANYVAQRLRDIERFEDMMRGYYRTRRKRNI